MNRSLRNSYPTFLLMVNIGLVGLILVVTMLTVRKAAVGLLSDSPAGKPDSPAVQSLVQETRQAIEDYAEVVRNNPFGIPAGELTKLTDGKASVTPVSDLRLLGTIFGQRHLSYAILADKSLRQEIFRVGDKVFDAGTLAKVERDRVLIRNNGRTVEIPFVELGVTSEPADKSHAIAPSGGFGPQSVVSTGTGSFIVDQKAIMQAIEKPQQLMTDARLQPNISSGKQEGFILREVKPTGIYHLLGLKNNDILLRINNFDITGPETALQAFTALRGMDRIALDIVRGGSRMTLTYQIR